jgi:hypothetical protein
MENQVKHLQRQNTEILDIKIVLIVFSFMFCSCDTHVRNSSCADISVKDIGCINELGEKNIKYKFQYQDEKLVKIYVTNSFTDSIEIINQDGINIFYFEESSFDLGGILPRRHYLFVKNDTIYEYLLSQMRTPNHSLLLDFHKTIGNEVYYYSGDINCTDTINLLNNISSDVFQHKINQIEGHGKDTVIKNHFKLSNFL